MDDSTHTPGPWKAVKAIHGPIDVFDSSDADIVTVYGSYSPRRQEANARLIAAAPDMLAALKEAQVVIDADACVETYTRISAAIREAEPRQ